MIKISQRLDCIKRMTKDYDHLWDLCCDHGKLALSIHQDSPEKMVYALDILKHQIKKLPQELKNFFPIAADATSFEYPNLNNQKACFIIAGVGSEVAIKIIQRLQETQGETLSLLLCIHQRSYLVRNYLKDDFSLVNEEWLRENKKGYDIFICENITRPKNKINLLNKQMDKKEARDLQKYFELKKTYNPHENLYQKLLEASKAIEIG